MSEGHRFRPEKAPSAPSTAMYHRDGDTTLYLQAKTPCMHLGKMQSFEHRHQTTMEKEPQTATPPLQCSHSAVDRFIEQKCNSVASLMAQWLRIHLPMQRARFEPWSGKIPHAAEQLSPRATTTEPVL